MSELPTFLLQHWWLSAICLLTTLYILLDTDSNQNTGLDPNQVIRSISDGAVLIDVRNQKNSKQGIKGALNIEFIDKLYSLPKKIKPDQAIILFCDDMKLSTSAKNILLKKSYSNVQVLSGGLQSWIKLNYPTVSTKEK